LPIKGLCNIPIPASELLVSWWLMTYAFSPLGYVFTLVAPGNAVVLTSSAALVYCAFGTGFFGLKLLDLSPGFRSVFPWLSPGCPALYLLSFGSAIYRPLSLPRAFLLYQMLLAGLVERPTPTAPIDDVRIEQSDEFWQRESMLQMFVFGSVLRVATLVLFTWRGNSTWDRLASPERREWIRSRLTSNYYVSQERQTWLRDAWMTKQIASVGQPPALHTVDDSALASKTVVKSAVIQHQRGSTRHILAAQHSSLFLQLPPSQSRPSVTIPNAHPSSVQLVLPTGPIDAQAAHESTTEMASTGACASAVPACQSCDIQQSRVERARIANSHKACSNAPASGSTFEPPVMQGSQPSIRYLDI